MAIRINFFGKYRKVTKNGHVFISGNPFIGDNLVSNDMLLADLGEIGNIDQLKAKLESYNGFFAFIINHGNELFASVDRIRSIPLFYGEENNNFYISNDAEWVRTQVCDENMSLTAQQEYLLTCYVTGQDTLFEKVKQLQAGEYLYLKHDNNSSMKIITERYYKFLHKEPKVLPEAKPLQEKLDEVTDGIIRRLAAYAGEGGIERQIVIPLSAGRDSRLIALKLKQIGYKNVLCFSYGVTGNFEAETSKKVAGFLGFPWEFVAYEEKWKVWFNTVERKNYYGMACNYVSLPHEQDWPAVWALKKRGVIASDAVFVPGHSGDFPAGSHIPFDANPDTKACMADLVHAILRSHYSQVWSRKLNKVKYSWKDRIIKNCEAQEITDGYGYADAFEKWDWQERQAKFIVNSVRVYEFWGFDWWLPFWDNDFMLYWENIPLQYRKNKILYNQYVDDLYETITGDKSCIEKQKIEKNKDIKFLLKKFHLYYFALRINDLIRRGKRRISFLNNIHALKGVFSEEFREKYRNKAGINGMLAILTLREMGGNVDRMLE
jgi:asparagine synthase (glutamine-hydrolysing)